MDHDAGTRFQCPIDPHSNLPVALATRSPFAVKIPVMGAAILLITWHLLLPINQFVPSIESSSLSLMYWFRFAFSF